MSQLDNCQAFTTPQVVPTSDDHTTTTLPILPHTLPTLTNTCNHHCPSFATISSYGGYIEWIYCVSPIAKLYRHVPLTINLYNIIIKFRFVRCIVCRRFNFFFIVINCLHFITIDNISQYYKVCGIVVDQYELCDK